MDKINPYQDCMIYGPYLQKDGRRYIYANKFDGSRKRKITYSRYLMEMHLGRILETHEEVHHKDYNKSNDSLDNLEVVKTDKHRELHSNTPETLEVNCFYCGEKFFLNKKQQWNRRSKESMGLAGPFCSQECSGKYGTDIQYNKN